MRPLFASCLRFTVVVLGVVESGVILPGCAGPRIVLGADAQSVTAASYPTQPPISVAQHLDRRAAPSSPAPAAMPATPAKPATVYACPMHPEVTSTDPEARCPKCGMRLEVKP